MSEKKYDNSKNGCITCKRTPQRPEEMLHTFLLCNCLRKNGLCELNARESGTKEGFNKYDSRIIS